MLFRAFSFVLRQLKFACHFQEPKLIAQMLQRKRYLFERQDKKLSKRLHSIVIADIFAAAEAVESYPFSFYVLG